MGKETVIIFGSPKDPEVQQSINRVALTGRKTEVKPRPNFETNTCQCGKHLGNCNTETYNDAYPGDEGATMSHCY